MMYVLKNTHYMNETRKIYKHSKQLIERYNYQTGELMLLMWTKNERLDHLPVN